MIGPSEVVRQVRVQTARRHCTLCATHAGGLCLVVFMWTFWFISSHPLTFSTQSHPKIHPEHMLWIAWARFESSQTSPQAMVTIYITVLQLLDYCVLWVDGGIGTFRQLAKTGIGTVCSGSSWARYRNVPSAPGSGIGTAVLAAFWCRNSNPATLRRGLRVSS